MGPEKIKVMQERENLAITYYLTVYSIYRVTITKYSMNGDPIESLIY